MSENLEGNSLILFSSPQTLLDIVSFKLALICWRCEFHNILISCDLSIRTPDFNFDVLRVSLPSHISNVINLHIKLVAPHLVSWIAFHKERIFHAYRINVILTCFDCIVYRSDGKICYQSTARNLLASERLDLEEKYRIACVYCFKEDIDHLWPLVMDKVSLGDCSVTAQYADLLRRAHPRLAVTYWSGVKRNEYSIAGSHLIRCEMHPLAQFEFYWNTFGVPELATWPDFTVIGNHREPNHHDAIKFLISRLNVTDQKYLLKVKPCDLILSLASEDVESCNCSVQVWKHVKDFVTIDQFFLILEHLRLTAFGLSTKCIYMSVILREIWIAAPKHLRDDILKNRVGMFFFNLAVPVDRLIFGRDMGFYIDVLSNLNSDLRLRIWFKNWHKFICLATVPDLDKLMKLCLVDENAIVSFKNDFMMDYTKLKSEFLLFIKTGFYEELLNYLTFCCSDTTRVQKIQQQILSSVLSDSFFSPSLKANYSWNTFIQFNEFINRAFPSKYLADQFKTQFVTNLLSHLKTLVVMGRYLDDARNLITCLASCNIINQLKQDAYRICQEVLKSGCIVEFNVRPWQLFLKWCAPSEEECLQFKKSLPLDNIFATFLTRVIKGQKELRSRHLNTTSIIHSGGALMPNYISFNNFLRWYFGSDEAANNFKYSKIWNCKNIEAIKAVLRVEKIDIIIDMLKWFFNNDKNQVVIFFSSFIQAKISVLGDIIV